MRRIKCSFLVSLLGVLSLFLPCMLLVNGANAQNYYDAFRVDLSSSTAYGTLSNYSGSISSSGVVFTRTSTSGSDYINQINMCRTQIYPKNALVFFTIKNSNRVPIVLTSGSNNYSVQNISYGEYGDVSYTIYLDNTTNEYTCLSFYVDSAELTGGGTINITKPNGIILTPGATTGQVQTIANLINQMLTDQDTTNDTLDDILTAINGLNLSGITDAINSQSQQQHSDSQAEQQKQQATTDAINEQNDKDDEDRSNLESQSSDINDAGDSSQESAESTGTSLLTAFTSFVSHLTYAISNPSNNCNLNMNMGNLNLGNVDLCTLSPPAEFQTIGSIFMVLFCVPLSIATARKLISLIRSFQG